MLFFIARETKRRKIGALGLSLLASALCASAIPLYVRFDVRNPRVELLLKLFGPSSVSATFDNCFMDRPSMMALVKKLPSDLMSASLNLLGAPCSIPTQDQEKAAPQCKLLGKLEIVCPSGSASPNIFAWVSLLFPVISELEIDVDALPVRGQHPIDHGQLVRMKMEKVKGLVLKGEGEIAARCPIYPNLEFFPNMRSLKIGYAPTIAVLEDACMKDEALSHLEELILCNGTPVSKVFLDRISTQAPLLKELSIPRDIFREIAECRRHEGQGGFSFSALTKLTIRADVNLPPQQIILSGGMADAFPSLLAIEITGPALVEVPFDIATCKPMPEVRSIKMVNVGRLKLDVDPEILKQMFPNLEL